MKLYNILYKNIDVCIVIKLINTSNKNILIYPYIYYTIAFIIPNRNIINL